MKKKSILNAKYNFESLIKSEMVQEYISIINDGRENPLQTQDTLFSRIQDMSKELIPEQ